MSWLSKMFGGGSPKGPVAEEYNGFRIFAEPMQDGKRYRIAARIEREIDGEVKSHQLIRADTLEGLDAAIEASAAKARQVIDEQGERIFS
ncbi:hypothetical protein FHS72_002929 [Loktanella ponticola]|uniref:Transcriptional activator HlyU n=1 Tax=Yoonia ponticola TaxID=1524255 RepID=A0A7W9BMK5_9RHOB|nr:HlyU family transcriptional regulator [Yoonia ponticola]MBB5723289.1 hypothetical protein [Yoonia ponticola]